MKFSEYVILAKPGLMMDPLGFLSPAANLQDTLFRQFTVLTNHPAYHGLLALIYRTLQSKGLTPGQPAFALEFRKLEILWGLANAVVDDGVLNVTKYRPLVQAGESVNLASIARSHGIYDRLAYGTLGHYSAPSSVWGLTGKDRTQLSDSGNKLAEAFAQRHGVSLAERLAQWYEKTSLSVSELENLGGQYAISCTPGDDEKAVWRDVITQYCKSAPHTACYWSAPLTSEELAGYQRSPAAYAGMFPDVQERYPELASRLAQMARFQSLAAVTQYVFEREYLLLSENDVASSADDLEEQLVRSMGKIATAYAQGPFYHDNRGLFKSLAGVSSYRSAADIILRHHVRHQNAKNVSPFMENGRLLVLDRFQMADFAALREDLVKAGKDNALAHLDYRYRRDWHFGRAWTYHHYARQTA